MRSPLPPLKNRLSLLVCALLSGLLGQSGVRAQQTGFSPLLLDEDTPPAVIEDRPRLEIGVFGAGLTTAFRIDPSSTVQDTEVSGEGDLALVDFKAIPHLTAGLGLIPSTRWF